MDGVINSAWMNRIGRGGGKRRELLIGWGYKEHGNMWNEIIMPESVDSELRTGILSFLSWHFCTF